MMRKCPNIGYIQGKYTQKSKESVSGKTVSVNFNTNIISSASLRSLFNSTISLNTTMQRLSTGLRINSAADNAANLSLSKKIDSKASGLSVANNNIQTGISKLQTFDGYMGGISNNLQRIRNLAVQAANGTYSSSERNMINNEAQAILAEVEQASNQANTEIGAARTNVTGLINDVVQIAEAAIPATYTAIKTATQLRDAINAGLNGNYMLMNDIDMSELGTVNRAVITGNFTGTFDGNGYKIKNLTITSSSANSGLFGQTTGATIKNVILENTSVSSTSNTTGSLIGDASNTTITNVASINANVKGNNYTGGLIGYENGGSTDSSYTSGNIVGNISVGGLVGQSDSNILSSYSSSNVIGNTNTGGIAGSLDGNIISSFAIGNISGQTRTGGLVGYNHSGYITTSYSTGTVLGQESTGGLAGSSYGDINLSYSTGEISGQENTGGLVGYMDSSSILSSYASGNISGTSSVGGFCGQNINGNIESSYATGNVIGTGSYIGGFTGGAFGDITSSYSKGNVSGFSFVGGFAGESMGALITSSHSYGDTSGNNRIGGFIGHNIGIITSSSSSGKTTGISDFGGFAGYNDGDINSTNFWNIDSSGQTTSAGSAVGKTSVEFDAMTPITSSWSSNDWDTSFENPVLKAIKNGNINLQIGAENNKNSSYAIKNMGLNFGAELAISLGSATSALSAISSIDKALSYLSSKRSDIGSSMNTLSGKLSTNTTRKENFINSSGVLKDADMAVESAKFTKQQILRSMGISILQQSQNMQADSISQLLGL